MLGGVPGGKSGLVSSTVGCPRSVASLPSAATGQHAVVGGVVERPLGGLSDDALLGLLGRRVGRVVQAVEQPRVGEEAHVHHVDADVAGVGQRVERGLQEEEAGVLAGADVDERDLGCDAGDAEAVDRRADRAGDVGAVAVVVLVGRVDAGRVLARSVDVGVVDDEVAAQAPVEVGRDVGVAAVDAGVDDADQHPAGCPGPWRTSRWPWRRSAACPTAGWPAARGPARPPRTGRGRRVRLTAGALACLAFGRQPLDVPGVRACRVRRGTDDAVAGRSLDQPGGIDSRREGGIGAGYERETDLGVLLHHASAGTCDDRSCNGGALPLLVQHHILVASRRGRRGATRRRGRVGAPRRSFRAHRPGQGGRAGEHHRCRRHACEDSAPGHDDSSPEATPSWTL